MNPSPEFVALVGAALGRERDHAEKTFNSLAYGLRFTDREIGSLIVEMLDRDMKALSELGS